MTFVKQHFKYLLQIVLVGTQADLKNDSECLKKLEKYGKKPITKEDGERLAEEFKAAGYVETSAKTGEGVHKAIQMGIKAVLKDDGPYDLTSREGFDEQYKNKVFLST